MRGLYCSGSRDSEDSCVNVVKNDPALTGVYFQPNKGLQLPYAEGAAADVFGQRLCQQLEVSLAHGALEARRNEP